MTGTANDAAFLYLTDLGFTGPDAGKEWFAVFRFHGPLEGCPETTWTLNDFERME